MARKPGISAFVRCRNEEEFIAASLLSSYEVFDEIVVILNRSTDGTRTILDELRADHPKIHIAQWDDEVAAPGASYAEHVARHPEASLARYYNWCVEQTTCEYVCKWDGDMIALPTLRRVREHLGRADVILFNGYDALGKCTTNLEPRIFRYDASRARYADWDLYEYLEYDYERSAAIAEKCYLHVKLVKREWWHREWRSPNDDATRPYPSPVPARRGFASRVLRRLGVTGDA